MVSLGSYWNDGKKWFFAITEDGTTTTNAYEGRQGAILALVEAVYTENEAKALLTNIVVRRFNDADILDVPTDCRILEDEEGLENYVVVNQDGMVMCMIYQDSKSALDDAAAETVLVPVVR